MSRQPYMRPVPKATWYMRNGRYRRYMLREITCLLVGVYSFLIIRVLQILATGSPERWSEFLSSQKSPVLASFHTFALIFFLVYQTFDWFKLAPKAMPLQMGERKLPDLVVVIAHYLAWVVASAFIFWLAGVL